MKPALLAFALCGILPTLLSGCGGMVRAVKVLPETADQLCKQTRPPAQAEDCAASPPG